MYGLILYYATATFDFYYRNIEYSRPEVLYFWGYYFAVNFIWMVIPGRMVSPFLQMLRFCANGGLITIL